MNNFTNSFTYDQNGRPRSQTSMNFYGDVSTDRYAYALEIARGSKQDELISKAAADLRAIYLAGISNAEVVGKSYESHCYACVDTFTTLTTDLANDCQFDDKTLDIVETIRRRVFSTEREKPATLETLVRMQLKAIDYARAFKLAFAQQLELQAA